LGGHVVILAQLENGDRMTQVRRMRRAPAVAVPVLLALGVALSACDRETEAPAVPSIATLQEDPILLSRVLNACNANPSTASNPECINARAAVDRRSSADEAAREKQAEAGFEKAREARRRAEDAARERETTGKRPSPYDLPVDGDGKGAPAAP
jgi:hypothetical protein